MVQLSIFGKDCEGRDVFLGGELVSKGTNGWGDYIEDIKKAQWYLEYLIQRNADGK